MTNIDLVGKLRELARIYEENPDVPELYQLTVATEFVFCPTKKEFIAAIRAFGSGKKNSVPGDEYYGLAFVPDAFPNIQIRGVRASICERVVVGKKTIPATKEMVLPATPEREEEIIEWICPESFLATGATGAADVAAASSAPAQS